MEPAFNRHLQYRPPSPSERVGGKGYIETPANAENLRWQTRDRAPTDYENALGDMLEDIYESDTATAHGIVEGLNRRNLRTADGERWTVEKLAEEMAALGR